MWFNDPCVIVQILEGLGNQMFCYATGRALALRNDVPLYLDTHSQYRINRFNRKYLLDNYEISGQVLSQIVGLSGNVGHLLWKTKLFRPGRNVNFYIERSYALDEHLVDLPVDRPTFLLGYWHHETYFLDAREQIIKDFERKVSPSRQSMDIASRISRAESVCIHARSYKELKAQNQFPVKYIQEAARMFQERLKNPEFFLFTDDYAWVVDHLQIDAPVVHVSCNASRGDQGAIDDMWLMNRCQHYILSSSSFGWWGAWLADNLDSLVIAPRDSLMGRNGVYSDQWILL